MIFYFLEPWDEVLSSRSRSGPNSTRRNLLVSTRDSVVGPNRLKRTSENPKNLFYNALYQNFQLKIGHSAALTVLRAVSRAPSAWKLAHGSLLRATPAAAAGRRGCPGTPSGLSSTGNLDKEPSEDFRISDVRSELLRPESGLPDPVKHLRMCF